MLCSRVCVCLCVDVFYRGVRCVHALCVCLHSSVCVCACMHGLDWGGRSID